jgi:hypothetical protein
VVVTCFWVIRPLVIVVVAVSFTTVPSGWVVVVVFVVEVVALVVTGEGGITTGGAVWDDEQPAIDPQTAMITKPQPRTLRTLMIPSCPRHAARVKENTEEQVGPPERVCSYIWINDSAELNVAMKILLASGISAIRA